MYVHLKSLEDRVSQLQHRWPRKDRSNARADILLVTSRDHLLRRFRWKSFLWCTIVFLGLPGEEDFTSDFLIKSFLLMTHVVRTLSTFSASNGSSFGLMEASERTSGVTAISCSEIKKSLIRNYWYIIAAYVLFFIYNSVTYSITVRHKNVNDSVDAHKLNGTNLEFNFYRFQGQ